LRDASKLLPLAICPRLARYDHAAVFLPGAVPKEAKPRCSVYRVRANELLAVERRGFNIQPVHEIKEKVRQPTR
jgi:hypothetical protein